MGPYSPTPWECFKIMESVGDWEAFLGVGVLAPSTLTNIMVQTLRLECGVMNKGGVGCRNQWYDVQGFGANINWEYGPWNITMEEHNLADGILHPNSIDHRVLCFPSGNNGWIQMYLKPNDPRSVVFSELFFYPSKRS